MKKKANKAKKGLLRNSRGIATSLLEATATIAVGAALAAAALGVIATTVSKGKVAAARADAKALANAVTHFLEDNTFFPFFLNAADRAPNAFTVEVLKSEHGDEAEFGSEKEKKWTTGSFDFLENQLIKNSPGAAVPGVALFSGTTRPAYPVPGDLAFDPKRGWRGPYLSNPPSTDPWGNKYYVNIKFLDPFAVQALTGDSETQHVVFVLSAGPNETIQTPFTLKVGTLGQSLDPVGDDVAERLR